MNQIVGSSLKYCTYMTNILHDRHHSGRSARLILINSCLRSVLSLPHFTDGKIEEQSLKLKNQSRI